jgi:hypothetical protein
MGDWPAGFFLLKRGGWRPMAIAIDLLAPLAHRQAFPVLP